MGSKFGKMGPKTWELATLGRLEKSSYFYNGRNVVTILVPLFLDGSSSFWQVTRTTIKAWTSVKFVQNWSPITELASLERLENQ